MQTEKLSAFIRDLTDKGKFSGVVLLRRESEDLFCGAFGYASRSWKILNAKDMVFQHSSITKMFTAVAALQLVEEGLLSFESRVQNILKLNVSNVPSNVTLHHLLTHTSGIADYFEEYDSEIDGYEEIWGRYPNYTFHNLADFLPLFVGKNPLCNAGDNFSYCNAGYILVGLMIEKVADVSYYEFVRKNVFLRAGMDHADFFPLDGVRDNVAEGHQPVKDVKGNLIGWKKNVFALPLRGASDGGSFSTTHDLVRFMQSLREGKLLSQEMTSMMLQPQGPVQVESDGEWAYGYGMALLLEKGEVVRYGHSGDDPGVSAKVFHYPDQAIDLVILGNQSHCSDEVGRFVHELIMSGELTA